MSSIQEALFGLASCGVGLSVILVALLVATRKRCR